MIIKYKALESNLSKTTFPLYIITGQDPYLLNNAAFMIKKAWAKQDEFSENIIDVNKNEWDIVFEEANSYPLFTELTLLDVRFNKKSFDTLAKKSIQTYLEKHNSKCLIIIRAPLIPQKQLQWVSTHKKSLVIQVTPFNKTELEDWIGIELKNKKILFEKSIPELIYQYSQHNMLAASQAIEKLDLINESGKIFTNEIVIPYLTDQCEYPIYDLADACLTANGYKTIEILKKISQNRGEPLYILWILSQEVRLLLKLKHLIAEQMSINTACNKLKIWPKRVRLYDITLKRFSRLQLQNLLQHCAHLDEVIKSNSANNIWDRLEQLALLLCFGWELQ
jgi:DNA polymerase III subunit delta